MSDTVVIFGATDPLGRRVATLEAAADSVGRVVLVDPDGAPGSLLGRAEVVGAGADAPEVKDLLADADVLVVVGAGPETGPDGQATVDAAHDVATARTLLEAAASAGVRHLVLLSSAMVYGAWPNNPVPLTEDAPLRPDPGVPYASARAEIERLALEWRDRHPDATVAVLRPTVSVAAASEAWLASSPWSASALRAYGGDRPSQFLHLDDLASAVSHAARGRLDGPFNVSADGWLPADGLAELAGPVARIHLPAGLKGRLVKLRSDMGTTGPPPGWAYTRHSWVVANDRLRSTGWEPRHRNEEVYIEADPGGPLASLSPRRRQELSLVVAAGLVAAAAGGVVWALRRRAHHG